MFTLVQTVRNFLTLLENKIFINNVINNKYQNRQKDTLSKIIK